MTYNPIQHDLWNSQWFCWTDRLAARYPLDQRRSSGRFCTPSQDKDEFRVALLLKNAEGLQTETSQIINGDQCVVVSGKTRSGQITGWFAPAKNYSAIKWEIDKVGGNIVNGYTLPKGESDTIKVEVTNFSHMGKYFIPTAGTFTDTEVGAGGNVRKWTDSVVRSNIDLAVDFDKVKAFDFDIPEGATVFLPNQKGIRYIWHNGKAVPDFDPNEAKKIDKEVAGLRALPGAEIVGELSPSPAVASTTQSVNLPMAETPREARRSVARDVTDVILAAIVASVVCAGVYWLCRKKPA